MYRLFQKAIEKGQSEGLFPLLASVMKQFHLKAHDLRISIRYRAATPRRDDVIHVDPANIDYIYFGEHKSNIPNFGVVGGEWDKYKSDIMESIVQKGLTQRFADGKAWDETIYYETGISAFENNDTLSAISDGYEQSEDGMMNYFEYLDELYEDLKTDGFRSTSELDLSNHPVVHIGRDGELILSQGNHRVAMSRVSGLTEIPTRVGVRHKQWQTVRQRLSRMTVEEAKDSPLREYLDHPDVIDFVDE